jgi:Leucine-rich repeat (LRR) protein
MKMKKLIAQLALFFCFSVVKAQTINIPDVAFERELLTQGVDLNGDGKIQKNEAQKVTILYVKNQGIKDLEGLSNFTNLIEFGCYGNQIKNLDLSKLKKLQYVYANNNILQSININGLVELKHIYLQNNPNLYMNVDFLQFEKIEELNVENTRAPKLDLKNLKNLKIIEATNSRLTDIQIDGCENLEQLGLEKNMIVSVDFKKLPKIEYISLSYNPVKSIDIRQLKKLKNFSCLDCYNLKQINTSGCENLEPILW